MVKSNEKFLLHIGQNALELSSTWDNHYKCILNNFCLSQKKGQHTLVNPLNVFYNTELITHIQAKLNYIIEHM